MFSSMVEGSNQDTKAPNNLHRILLFHQTQFQGRTMQRMQTYHISMKQTLPIYLHMNVLLFQSEWNLRLQLLLKLPKHWRRHMPRQIEVAWLRFQYWDNRLNRSYLL